MVSSCELPENDWQKFSSDLIGKAPEEVKIALTSRFGISPDSLTPIKDIVNDTAERIASGDYMEEGKVRRRLGLEYGPLNYEEREELRAEVARLLPAMFLSCEQGGLPLVALVGYGSLLDLRIGVSLTESDLDLKVIPLNGQEDGAHAGGKIREDFKNVALAKMRLGKIDTHFDWLTGGWLEANLPRSEKMDALRQQFKYVKPGSVVIARNRRWADLLNNALELETNGVVVVPMDLE